VLFFVFHFIATFLIRHLILPPQRNGHLILPPQGNGHPIWPPQGNGHPIWHNSFDNRV
jgi:hypothetical protein